MNTFSQKNLDKVTCKNREMNNLSLKCCESIRVGDVLYYSLEDQVPFSKSLRSMIKIFVSAFYPNSYDFCMDGKPYALAIFSNSYRRKDQQEAFTHATDLLTDCIKMIPSGRKLDLLGIRYLWLPFLWIHQMRKVESSLRIRTHYSFVLFQAFLDYEIWKREERKNKWDIHHLLTYNDVAAIDCFFVQKFNAKNIMTTTFQHGTHNISINPWAYQGSHSTNFLIESQMGADNAKMAGYAGNLIVVGSPHLITQKENNKIRSDFRGVVGAIMNSPEQPHEDNVAMLTTLQKYCKAQGKKLFVKWHPSDNLALYDDIVDHSVVTTFDSEITMEQFAYKIEYAIVSASTSFLTMLNLDIPAFLYVRKGHDPNLFRGAEKLKFTTASDLDERIVWSQTNEYAQEMNKIKKYLLPQGNIEENYRKAYGQLGLTCKSST